MIRKSLSLFVTAGAVLGAGQVFAAVGDPHQNARQMIAPPTISTVVGQAVAQRLASPAFVAPDALARKMIRGESVGATTANPLGQLQSHAMGGDLHQRVQAMILCKK